MLRQLNSLFDGSFAAIAEPLLKDCPNIRLVRATLKSGVGVVVKITSNADPGDKLRAKREIKLLRMFSELKVQHICGFRDSTVTAAYSAVILECMELGTVRDFLDTAPPDHTLQDPSVSGGATRLRLQSLLHICTDVLTGLAAMHDHGVCHRDIKPANIGATMMTSLGRVGYKIIDLDIAVKQTSKGYVPSSLPAAASSSSNATATSRSPGGLNMVTGLMTGVMELKRPRGTPLFMSPEQLDAKRAVSL